MGFHCINDFAASLLKIIATPLSCFFSSPENNITSPSCVWCFPCSVHLLSPTPRTPSLYFLISRQICSVFPLLCMVLTFQLPILMLFFGCMNTSLRLLASWRFWPVIIMWLLTGEQLRLAPGWLSEFGFVSFVVSVIIFFWKFTSILMLGDWPCDKPPKVEDPGLSLQFPSASEITFSPTSQLLLCKYCSR